jgi:symplekin
VPDTEPLSQLVVDFALSLYARLERVPEPEPEPEPQVGEIKTEGEQGGEGHGEDEMDMDDEDTPPPEPVKIPFAVVKQGRVVDRLDAPKILHDVLQHVELLLALCVKQPDLLEK